MSPRFPRNAILLGLLALTAAHPKPLPRALIPKTNPSN